MTKGWAQKVGMTTGHHPSVGRPGGDDHTLCAKGSPAGGGWPQTVTQRSADQVGYNKVRGSQVSRAGAERPQAMTKGSADQVQRGHRP